MDDKLDFDSIKQQLIQKGYPLVGAVDYDLAQESYQFHAQQYQNWINSGAHGEMQYLERGLERRLDPQKVFPELKSVITVARPYAVHKVEKNEIRYARYLNGPDYHTQMKSDLDEVFRQTGLSYKVCVDTSAVLERAWGAITGLGWIGKNTLLIHPQYGSFFFIGVIFVGARVGRSPSPLKDYCGSCERCLQGCPTSAFDRPKFLDSKKCISYLTLEKRGEWTADQAKAVQKSGYLAGCDICQDVCPYNTKAQKYGAKESVSPVLEFDLEKLEQESEAEYRERIRGSSISRIKYLDFRRNLHAVRKK